jgi:hypothetical protein
LSLPRDPWKVDRTVKVSSSLARSRHDHAWVVSEAPDCRAVGTPERAAEQVERPSRLTTEDRDTIRLLAETRSPREQMVEFGVSPETAPGIMRVRTTTTATA